MHARLLPAHGRGPEHGHDGTLGVGHDDGDGAPAFERGDTFFQHHRRRIADAAVAMARHFEIEQGCAVVGAVVSCATSDAVAPASTITVCFVEPA